MMMMMMMVLHYLKHSTWQVGFFFFSFLFTFFQGLREDVCLTV
jgi:hypothetical protein